MMGKPKALELAEIALLIKALAAEGVTLSSLGVAAPEIIVDPATQLAIVIASVFVLDSPSARSIPATKFSIPEERKVAGSVLSVNVN